jgi:hypothetical protein
MLTTTFPPMRPEMAVCPNSAEMPASLCTLIYYLKCALLILDLPARDLALAPEAQHQVGRATV